MAAKKGRGGIAVSRIPATNDQGGTETADALAVVIYLEDGSAAGAGGGGGGGDASAANQTALNTLTGAVTETAPANDTASSGLNGRLQRIAQRITTLIGSTIAVSAASLPLPTGAATSAAQTTAQTSLTSIDGKLTKPTTLVSRIVSAAASTNATSAKASAGTALRVIGYNARASAVYLKLYNKASAPTVGTDTPVLTIYLPTASGFAIDIDMDFATGIAYALTTGSADADTGALTAADVLGLNLIYA